MDGLDEWILKYQDFAPEDLLLHPPREFTGDVKQLALQIQSRRKAANKLPTWVQNPRLRFPSLLSIEQASSEATAGYKQRLFPQAVTDLTGGLGIDCWALALAGKTVRYVEPDAAKCLAFEHNMRQLKLDVAIFNETAESYLDLFPPTSEMYLIDPDRRDQHRRKRFRFADCRPDMGNLQQVFTAKNRWVVKASPMLDIQAGIKELERVEEVHVVEWQNEVREILFVCGEARDNPRLVVADAEGQFIFRGATKPSERNGDLTADLEEYVYLPAPAIVKAGWFHWPTTQFALKKVSKNTHVYTGQKHLPQFPGRCFSVLAISPSKKLISKQNLHVLNRNHPVPADVLSKKYQLKPSGDRYLLAYRDLNEKPRLALLQLIPPNSK